MKLQKEAMAKSQPKLKMPKAGAKPSKSIQIVPGGAKKATPGK